MDIDHTTTTIREIISIKRHYCKDCKYFQGVCTKEKLIKKCFKNNERLNNQPQQTPKKTTQTNQHKAKKKQQTSNHTKPR